MNSTFVTLTALGALLGVSNRQVGRCLKELRLRDEKGRPTQESLDQGFVLERELKHGGVFWLWHMEKTVKVLEARGEPASVAERHDGFIVIRGGK